MVDPHRTANPVRPKRRRRGRKKHRQLHKDSVRLVKSGRVEIAPCAACGSTEDLTIHHVPPLSADRFVFLCRTCHNLAHKPIYKKIRIADSHLSILPRALVKVQREVTHG